MLSNKKRKSYEHFHILTLVVSGDEIISVNGTSVSGLTHAQAISLFKSIKSGPVVVQIRRRNSAMRK